MSDPIWQPATTDTRLTEFQRALEARTGQSFATYAELHEFSIREPEPFWRMVWEYTQVVAETPAKQVLLGNIDPVRGLKHGTPESVTRAIAQCHREAGPRYIVGAGCEIPLGTPPENVQALTHYARTTLP